MISYEKTNFYFFNVMAHFFTMSPIIPKSSLSRHVPKKMRQNQPILATLPWTKRFKIWKVSSRKKTMSMRIIPKPKQTSESRRIPMPMPDAVEMVATPVMHHNVINWKKFIKARFSFKEQRRFGNGRCQLRGRCFCGPRGPQRPIANWRCYL